MDSCYAVAKHFLKFPPVGAQEGRVHKDTIPAVLEEDVRNKMEMVCVSFLLVDITEKKMSSEKKWQAKVKRSRLYLEIQSLINLEKPISSRSQL